MNNNKITEEMYPYFDKVSETKYYKAGQYIYFQGDLSNQFYVIKKGRVRVYFLSANGEEMTVEIVEKGRIFGESSFLSKTSRPTNVEAINDVELYACKIEDLIPYLSSSPKLMEILFKLLIQNLDHVSNQLHHLYFLNRFQKVAYFLIEQTSRANIDLNISSNCVPYSHQEIAYCVGISRVSVTKVLDYFKNEGWIDLKYKKVIILNREALIDYCEK